MIWYPAVPPKKRKITKRCSEPSKLSREVKSEGESKNDWRLLGRLHLCKSSSLWVVMVTCMDVAHLPRSPIRPSERSGTHFGRQVSAHCGWLLIGSRFRGPGSFVAPFPLEAFPSLEAQVRKRLRVFIPSCSTSEESERRWWDFLLSWRSKSAFCIDEKSTSSCRGFKLMIISIGDDPPLVQGGWWCSANKRLNLDQALLLAPRVFHTKACSRIKTNHSRSTRSNFQRFFLLSLLTTTTIQPIWHMTFAAWHSLAGWDCFCFVSSLTFLFLFGWYAGMLVCLGIEGGRQFPLFVVVVWSSLSRRLVNRLPWKLLLGWTLRLPCWKYELEGQSTKRKIRGHVLALARWSGWKRMALMLSWSQPQPVDLQERRMDWNRLFWRYSLK